MQDEELEIRFTYHPPKGDQPIIYQQIRAAGFQFAREIAQLTPESREQSLAITALEEAVFWANAAVARRSH